MKRLTFVATLTLVFTAACSGNVFALDVGECFDDPAGFAIEVMDVEMVDCDDPHDNEVYALFNLPDGDFPGFSAVESAAQDGCFASFSGYVGRSYASSSLESAWLVPTAESWEQGDREVVCVVYDLNLRKLTGSMKDSGT